MEALGDELDEVRIIDVHDGVFFASLVFASGAEVEARPSDSIAWRCAPAPGSCAPRTCSTRPASPSTTDEDEEIEKFREFLDDVEPEDFG